MYSRIRPRHQAATFGERSNLAARGTRRDPCLAFASEKPRKGRLSLATERFWQCAKEAAAATGTQRNIKYAEGLEAGHL